MRLLLEQATARRLPAGESVAVLLSGGVDSSLVIALAARLHDRPGFGPADGVAFPPLPAGDPPAEAAKAAPPVHRRTGPHPRV
ncbi:asparagine synthase-related protein [Kitasatospora sp. NBC_00085]|uniref:asparagine synthase-related protein n=1 Tax=unclassified Kitasatospora TaxID=2633591 RepID=UPI002F90DA0F